MGAMGTALKAAVALLCCLVAADVAGVIACSILDILSPRRWSVALPYTIWLVFGIFCGLYAYNFAAAWASSKVVGQDWTEQAGARRLGSMVLATGIALLAIAAGLCDIFVWRYGSSADDYYVPDSARHSIVFIVAVLGGMVLARFAFMPASKSWKQDNG